MPVIMLRSLCSSDNASQCWSQDHFPQLHILPLYCFDNVVLTDDFNNMLLSGFKCILKTSYFYKLSSVT